jgi:hypothetical protein
MRVLRLKQPRVVGAGRHLDLPAAAAKLPDLGVDRLALLDQRARLVVIQRRRQLRDLHLRLRPDALDPRRVLRRHPDHGLLDLLRDEPAQRVPRRLLDRLPPREAVEHPRPVTLLHPLRLHARARQHLPVNSSRAKIVATQ